MSINDTYTKLAKLGVARVTLAVDDKFQPAVLADQRIGGAASTTLLQHQCVGSSHENALDELLRRATAASLIGGPVVVDR